MQPQGLRKMHHECRVLPQHLAANSYDNAVAPEVRTDKMDRQAMRGLCAKLDKPVQAIVDSIPFGQTFRKTAGMSSFEAMSGEDRSYMCDATIA